MSGAHRGELVTRLTLGAVGLAGIAYGAYRLFGFQAASHPPKLAKWLVGAVLLHDLVLTPVVLGVGWLVTRSVRPRARRYVQGALVTGAMVAAIAVAMIHRRGKSLPGKTLLERNYAANLAVIIAVIAAVTASAYLLRVVRDRRAERASVAKVRPSADHTSSRP